MRRCFCFFLIFAILVPCFLNTPRVTYGADTSTIVQVAISDYYTFVLKSDGTLWDLQRDSSGPKQFMDSVKFVSFGDSHGMVIKKDGTLWGWGANQNGQVGNGTNEIVKNPIKVLDEVAFVSAGDFFTLAVKTDGSLWGWGDNAHGQLTSTGAEYLAVPTKIMDHVKTAIAGSNSSYIIKKDNTLWTLGNSPYILSKQAVQTSEAIQIGSDIVDVFINKDNDRVLFLKSDASLWTWTITQVDQPSFSAKLASTITGRSTVITSLTPLKLLDDVEAAEYQNSEIVILKKDGTLWNLVYYDYRYNERIDPTKILDDVVTFSFKHSNYLVVKKDGTLWSWGDSIYDYLYPTNPNYHLQPKEIDIFNDVSRIFMSDYSISFLREDHSLWAYQYTPRTSQYTLMKTMDHVKEVQYSDHFAVVLTDDQSLFFIKGNYSRELYWLDPVPMMDKVVSFDLSYNRLCAVTSDGSLWMLDLKSYSRDFEQELVLNPQKITDNVKEVALQFKYYDIFSVIYALKNDGSLWRYLATVPEMEVGELNDQDSPFAPKKIASDVLTVATTNNIYAFIKTDGSLWTYGKSEYGEAGYGTSEWYKEPTKILDHVTSFQLSYLQGMAIQKDGSLWAWGNNYTGLLGTGNTENQLVPVKIMEGVKSANLNSEKSFIQKNNGKIIGFGFDESGLYFGDNIDNYNTEPIQILMP